MAKNNHLSSRIRSFVNAEIRAYVEPIAGAAREVDAQWKACSDRLEQRMAQPSPPLPQLLKREFLAASRDTPILFFAPVVGFAKGMLGKHWK